MGTFSIDIEVGRVAPRASFEPVSRLLVDTCSEMTWIAEDLLRRLRIEVRKKDQPFVMANGQQVTRNIGYAVIRCGSFETVDEVVFAHPGDLQLLGARTLEGFNAIVDARRKCLVAAGAIPAA